MSEVARLVGMERRSYTKDGQARHYCGLHMVHVEGTAEGVSGSKVECVSCPREVDPGRLAVGKLYELQYSFYETRSGKMARLAGLVPVEEQ